MLKNVNFTFQHFFVYYRCKFNWASYFRFMKIWIFLLIIGLGFACKKGKGNFTLKGVVTDTTFSTPLSGAVIKLYQVPAGTSQEILIETKTLGSDGAYSFTFPRDKMERYVIKVTKNNYFSLNETVYFSELTLEEDNVANFSTTAKSWAKLRFINSNPQPGDVLTYIKQEGKANCPECCTTSEVIFYGALDTTIYCINDGNTLYSYFYSVSGTTNQGIRNATTIAFDTTEILLNY